MLEKGVCAKNGEVRDKWEGQGQVRSAPTVFILKRLDFQLQEMGSH